MRDAESEWRFVLGPSPAFWSEATQIQLARIEQGAKAHQAREPHRDRRDTFDGFGASLMHDLGPMQADAYFLLHAVRHVLRLAEWCVSGVPSRVIRSFA